MSCGCLVIVDHEDFIDKRSYSLAGCAQATVAETDQPSAWQVLVTSRLVSTIAVHDDADAAWRGRVSVLPELAEFHLAGTMRAGVRPGGACGTRTER